MDTSERPSPSHGESAWLQPAPESTLPVLAALAATIALQLAIPLRYTLVPRWPLIGLELLLIVVLIALNPVHLTRRTATGKYTILILLAAITLDNTGSAVLLDSHILTGKVSNDPAVLLGSGAAIFVTNMIVFGIWYWELDRGGPVKRCQVIRPHPDFMFPQMVSPDLAPQNWVPRFVDYFYLSITNVMAFSPTDVMPLTRRAKAMMTLQAVVAVSTISLVFARAVNVLS